MAEPFSNASAGKLKGRIGKLFCFELNGKPCVRSVPHREEPPTSAEKANLSPVSGGFKIRELDTD